MHAAKCSLLTKEFDVHFVKTVSTAELARESTHSHNTRGEVHDMNNM